MLIGVRKLSYFVHKSLCLKGKEVWMPWKLLSVAQYVGSKAKCGAAHNEKHYVMNTFL